MPAQSHSLKNTLLVVFAACILIGGHFFIALPQCNFYWRQCFAPDNITLAPFRYRILSFVLEPDILQPTSVAVALGTTLLIHSVCVLLTCLGLYIWLKRRTDADRAVMGIFILAAVWMLAYRFYLRNTSIAIELACITWVLVFMEWRLLPIVLPIVLLTILATLNRETGVFIPLIYAAYHFDMAALRRERRYQVNGVVLLATYAVIMGTIHLAMGSAEHTLGLAGTLQYNLDNLADGLLVNLILAPLGIIALMSYPRECAQGKRLLWVAALMVGTVAVGAAWGESARLLLVTMPLVLPVIIQNNAYSVQSSFTDVSRVR